MTEKESLTDAVGTSFDLFDALAEAVFLLDAEGRIILYTDRSAWKTSSKLYLCPLPSDQLQLNPQLGQNPGW